MNDITTLEDSCIWEQEWPEMAGWYQEACQKGEAGRLKLALALADQEYRHPSCEAAGSKAERRSFCFTHQKITRKAVLLIHGFTACPFEMREMGEYLYHQGYNVFGVRLEGHGTSVVEFSKCQWRDWEKSALKGLALITLLGYETVVIGESMGGALATLLARSYPTLICYMVLLAPCFRIKDVRARLIGFKLVQQLIPYKDMELSYGWQYDYWYNAIPSSAAYELVKLGRVASQTGAEIRSRTLVIQAENDQMVNIGAVRRFYQSLAQLTSEQKELILFEDGHHNLTVNLNPRKREVFEWVRQFLKQ